MDDIIEAFRNSRDDPGVAVLEGFHALKHAIRFGAEITGATTHDRDGVLKLAAELAPDITATLERMLDTVPESVFNKLVFPPVATTVLALARRPDADLDAVLSAPGPLVFLERPNHLGNIGAVVRVAAAAGAAGVLTSGTRDPWHPAALRGSAGLHFAVPVLRVSELPDTDRPLVALDPAGTPISDVSIPDRPVFAFGGERHGLSAEILARSELRIRIPMQPGVSSLNLATAAAIVLFAPLI
jgi:TrmH family RNA methyltransferase